MFVLITAFYTHQFLRGVFIKQMCVIHIQLWITLGFFFFRLQLYGLNVRGNILFTQDNMLAQS